MNVFIDIETLPNMAENAKADIEVSAPAQYKNPESIQKWLDENGEAEREKLWRKQALNPNEGQILSIGWRVQGQSGVIVTCEETEAETLKNFFINVDHLLKGRPPYFIGHNVPFDLGFIWKRAIINNVKLPFKIKPHGRHGSDFYDTMQAWEGFKGRISQNKLCKLLGIEGKPSDISGSNVLDHYLAGNIDKIKEYNADDVEKVNQIYNRINQEQ